MKKYLLISIIAILVLGGGGFALYNNKQNDKKEADKMAMQKEADDKAAMQKNDSMAKDKPAMQKDDSTMMVKGSFSDYDSAKLANAEKGKVVLFFSASWCPTCQEANKNLNASTAPEGLTLLKVDYDKSTELKQKYGVTYQHTYVQVDKNGNLIKKWSGSTSYDQIKSQIN